jgi:hypothetical protein
MDWIHNTGQRLTSGNFSSFFNDYNLIIKDFFEEEKKEHVDRAGMHRKNPRSLIRLQKPFSLQTPPCSRPQHRKFLGMAQNSSVLSFALWLIYGSSQNLNGFHLLPQVIF